MTFVLAICFDTRRHLATAIVMAPSHHLASLGARRPLALASEAHGKAFDPRLGLEAMPRPCPYRAPYVGALQGLSRGSKGAL